MYDYQLMRALPNGDLIDCCGSDFVGYVDKRLSLANRRLAVQKHAEQVNKRLKDNYVVGYKLHGVVYRINWAASSNNHLTCRVGLVAEKFPTSR